MTRDIDIDRYLETWFDEGPRVMPDRFFDALIARVDRTPQRRFARILTRVATMNRTSLLAAAAAIVVVAGLGGFILFNGPSTGVQPSPTPAVTTVPTVPPAGALQPIPAEVQGRWQGPTRVSPALTPPLGGSGMTLFPTSLQYLAGEASALFASVVQSEAPAQLTFWTSQAGRGCQVGDSGTYRYVVNATGDGMTVTPVSDACAARAAAMTGEWVRVGCPNTNWCLGDLQPGIHVSAYFNPFVPLPNTPYAYGRLSYTVPAGWVNPTDGNSGYILAEKGAADGNAIFVFQTAYAHLQETSCLSNPDPAVGHSAAAIATWLTTVPGIVATAPAAVTIGGLAGETLDVRLDPNWTRTCSFSNGQPTVQLFTNGLGDPDNFDWGVAGTGRLRLFLLDLPDGRSMLIDIEATDEASWNALIAKAMPIVQSFQFHAP